MLPQLFLSNSFLSMMRAHRGAQVSGLGCFGPEGVVGEHLLLVGRGPVGPPKPPWLGPFGGHVAFALALGFAWLAILA